MQSESNSSGSALVMSGGGAFGAFEAGCIKGISTRDPGRDYERYAGISVGGINAAMLAQFQTFDEGVQPLLDLWEGITGPDDVYRSTILGVAKGLISTGIYLTWPLRKLISQNLDIDKLNQSNKSLVFGTTNILDGSYKEIVKLANQPLPPDDKKALVDWLMATSAFPGAFPAIKVEEELYIDGGLSNAAPITSTILAGYDTIDVLLTGPKDNIIATTIDQVKNVIELLPRVLQTLFLSVWMQDLYSAYLLNKNREQADLTPAQIMVYAPPKPFTYDPLGFVPSDLQAMIEAGEATTAVPLKEFLFPEGEPAVC